MVYLFGLRLLKRMALLGQRGDDSISRLNKAMAFLTAVAYSMFSSTNNQLRTSSNLRNQAIIQDGKVYVQQFQGRQGQSYVGTSYKGHMARQCTQPKRPRNATWFKENAMLAEAQESGQILDEEQLAFFADLGIPNGQAAQTTIPNTAAFQTKDLDAYDSDCDDVSNAKAVLMVNLSSYGSDVISETTIPNTAAFQTKDLDAYDSDCDDVSNAKAVLMVNLSSYGSDVISERIKPILYDGSVISSQHAASPVIDDEETLILEDVSRSKMLAKQNDPMSKEKKVSTAPINYVELNQLSEDFGKRFVPQQELSDEQAFWLQTSHPNTDQFALSPVKIEAPKELSKVSLVNTSLKKLKYHLGQFVNVVKKRITPDAITEEEWGFEHTKTVFLKDIFNFFDKDLLNELQAKDTTIYKLKEHIKSMRENDKEEKVKHDMNEIETINIELEHSVAKLLSENECLNKEIEHLKNIYKDQFDSIKKTRALSKEHCDSLITQLNPKSMENADLKCQIQEKVFVTTTLQNELRRQKGKHVLDNATTIAPGNALENRILVNHSYTLLASFLGKGDYPGLKISTSASRSRPTRNKKNDMISQTSSSNMKNKVEVQRMRVKYKSNKKNRVKDPICDANVKHTMLNVNSELICVKCKQCMFDANHDVCFFDFANDVNVRSKSMSAKTANNIIFGNLRVKCSLKITSTKVVPIKETTSHSVETQKSEFKVYSRRPKQVKSVGLSKKAKIVESKIANNSEPNHLWASNATDVPSFSSHVNDRLSRLFSGIWTRDALNI
nr:hypothetical protein [Tanacetum cinerariifolium]